MRKKRKTDASKKVLPRKLVRKVRCHFGDWFEAKGSVVASQSRRNPPHFYYLSIFKSPEIKIDCPGCAPPLQPSSPLPSPLPWASSSDSLLLSNPIQEKSAPPLAGRLPTWSDARRAMGSCTTFQSRSWPSLPRSRSTGLRVRPFSELIFIK